jgi:hypothetical protein
MVMVHHKRESTSNGLSQEWFTIEEKKQKKTKALVSRCKCCTKLWRLQIRVWSIHAMSIVDMWLFGNINGLLSCSLTTP